MYMILQVKCLELERLLQEETLVKFKETLQQQKRDNKVLQERITDLEALEVHLSEYASLRLCFLSN